VFTIAQQQTSDIASDLAQRRVHVSWCDAHSRRLFRQFIQKILQCLEVEREHPEHIINNFSTLLISFQLRMQAIYSNNICIKCFDNVKNFCQFRKELLNNQAILYQVFSSEEERMLRENREENFIDISQAVKIKLEVTENDSFNSNEIHFESEATMHDASDQVTYNFKMEGNNSNDMNIYSEYTIFSLAERPLLTISFDSDAWGSFADINATPATPLHTKIIKRSSKPRNPLADNPREKQ